MTNRTEIIYYFPAYIKYYSKEETFYMEDESLITCDTSYNYRIASLVTFHWGRELYFDFFSQPYLEDRPYFYDILKNKLKLLYRTEIDS